MYSYKYIFTRENSETVQSKKKKILIIKINCDDGTIVS